MARQKKKDTIPAKNVPLIWLKAAYKFHTYAYRDPRSAFSSATGSPVVSPTTLLLGILSTLFSLGKQEEAQNFIAVAHQCKVVVDAPDGVVFFRAFHQLRRYETDKYGANPNIGLTKINQGTREYGLVEGQTTVYIGVPENLSVSTKLALLNLIHLGTHDSLCSIIGDIESCNEPDDVVYYPPEIWKNKIPQGAMAVSLSRFKGELYKKLEHWYLAGGDDTEIVPYFIKGRFEGTSRGKIYRKH